MTQDTFVRTLLALVTVVSSQVSVGHCAAVLEPHRQCDNYFLGIHTLSLSSPVPGALQMVLQL